ALPVRTERRHVVDGKRGADLTASLDIPNPNRVFIADHHRQNTLSVRAQRRGSEPIVTARGHFTDLPTTLYIPNSQGSVVAGGDDASPIRTEANSVHPAWVFERLANRLAGLGIPDTQSPVGTA